MLYIMAHKKISLLIYFLLIFLLEKVFKRFPIPSGFHKRYGKNITFGFVNHFILPLLIIPFFIFASQHELFHRSAFFLSPFFIIVDILILDCVSYFFHRICHNIPFLWRFHETHHLDPAFDVTTGLRIHTVELIFGNLFRFFAIFLFAIPLKSILIFELILVLEGLFHHCNISIPRKFELILEKIIISPHLHSVHHHAYQPNTDSNYGFIFVFWDKFFGSFNRAQRKADWQIGLEYSADLSLKELFIAPFRRTPLKDRGKYES